MMHTYIGFEPGPWSGITCLVRTLSSRPNTTVSLAVLVWPRSHWEATLQTSDVYFSGP